MMYCIATEDGWIGKKTTKSGKLCIVAADAATSRIWTTPSLEEAQKMARKCEDMHLYNRFDMGTGIIAVEFQNNLQNLVAKRSRI